MSCASVPFYGGRREYPPLRGIVREKLNSSRCSQIQQVQTKLQMSYQKPVFHLQVSAQAHIPVNPVFSLSQILMAQHSQYPKSDHCSPSPAHPSLVPGMLPCLLDFCQFPPWLPCSLLFSLHFILNPGARGVLLK